METNKKNIILLDVFGNFVNSILENERIDIASMIVENSDMAKFYKEKHGNRIKSFYYRILENNDEFNALNKTDYNLSYLEIEDFRSTQLKVEHYLHRELTDISTIQYRYFLALAYWLDFFNKNKIDMVFSAHIEHGGIWDTIIIDIAKKRNIPVYVISVTTGIGKQDEVDTLVYLNNNTFMDVAKFVLKSFKISDYIAKLTKAYSPLVASYSKNNIKEKLVYELKKRMHSFKQYKISLKDYYKRTKNYKYWYNLFSDEIKDNYQYMRDLSTIYDKISTLPVEGEKYIYFSLRLEPEATTMARSIPSTQLFLIKWLSDVLPNDWKIYVKDHPAQYNLCGDMFYFLRNISVYRNYDFLKTITDIPKVRLIKLNQSSDTLVENSGAVASISGSVTLKTVFEKKPLILFGQGLNMMENLKEVFVIDDIASLKTAVEKIVSGFTPVYDDIEDVIKKYTFCLPEYSCQKDRPPVEDIKKLIGVLLKD